MAFLREQPWHDRRAFHWHHRWYQDLLVLHRLTLEWLRELKLERPSHFLGASVRPEIKQSIESLERVTDRALESELSDNGLSSLLDDTAPEDFLGRLENSVLTLQAWTLQTLLDRSPEALEALEQVSWRHGRALAERRLESPLEQELDLRVILTFFADNPILGTPEREGLLIRRSTRTHVDVELKCCPHQSANPAALQVSDALCDVHQYWLKGFLYGLSPTVACQYERRSERTSTRCRLSLGITHDLASAPRA